MAIQEFSREQDLLSFIESCSTDELYEAFEEAAKNSWPYAFVSTLNRMIAENVDPSELVRQVLNDASWGRNCLAWDSTLRKRRTIALAPKHTT